MERRDFLKGSGALSAHLVVAGSLLSIRKAEADSGLPIAALQAELDPNKDRVLVPASKDFGTYNMSFNKRTQIAPRVRVVAGSAKAVSSTLLWAANNGLSFAIRSGGHSYEGYSQSPDLVIDVRGMTGIKLSTDKKSVSVGSGSSLGSVYRALWPSHLAIPAGSCFPSCNARGRTPRAHTSACCPEAGRALPTRSRCRARGPACSLPRLRSKKGAKDTENLAPGAEQN